MVLAMLKTSSNYTRQSWCHPSSRLPLVLTPPSTKSQMLEMFLSGVGTVLRLEKECVINGQLTKASSIEYALPRSPGLTALRGWYMRCLPGR